MKTDKPKTKRRKAVRKSNGSNAVMRFVRAEIATLVAKSLRQSRGRKPGPKAK